MISWRGEWGRDHIAQLRVSICSNSNEKPLEASEQGNIVEKRLSASVKPGSPGGGSCDIPVKSY